MGNVSTKSSSIPDLLMRFACGAIVALALSPTLGAQQPDIVKLATQDCGECHGSKGVSSSSAFPMLAGQRKDYLERQLKAFRDRSRGDPMAEAYMWGMTAQLSDETIAKLAAYYAGQSLSPGKSSSPKIIETGRIIYERGVPETKTSACATCHGKLAEGSATAPRLAGQYTEYLLKQLALFKSRIRAEAGAQSMHTVSGELTFDQMTAVSAYARSR